MLFIALCRSLQKKTLYVADSNICVGGGGIAAAVGGILMMKMVEKADVLIMRLSSLMIILAAIWVVDGFFVLFI